MKKYGVMVLVVAGNLCAMIENGADVQQPLLQKETVTGTPRSLKDRAPRLGDGTPLSVDTGNISVTPRAQDPDPGIGFTRAYTRRLKKVEKVEKEVGWWEIMLAKIKSCFDGQ